MKTKQNKDHHVNFMTTHDTRVLLDKLALIMERSMANTLEYLILKEARAEGLIEPVNKLLDK